MIRRWTDVELVVDTHDVVGESPVWDDGRAELVWIDILGKRLHTYDPATGAHTTRETDAFVGAFVLCPDGSLLAASETGFATLDRRTGDIEAIAAVPPTAADEGSRPATRMNDGKCDPAGRFLAGTMAWDLTPDAGGLYRLEPDGSVRTVLQDVTLSNGLDWSPDGTTFYFIDSMASGIESMK